jgi:hypothetical protein
MRKRARCVHCVALPWLIGCGADDPVRATGGAGGAVGADATPMLAGSGGVTTNIRIPAPKSDGIASVRLGVRVMLPGQKTAACDQILVR